MTSHTDGKSESQEPATPTSSILAMGVLLVGSLVPSVLCAYGTHITISFFYLTQPPPTFAKSVLASLSAAAILGLVRSPDLRGETNCTLWDWLLLGFLLSFPVGFVFGLSGHLIGGLLGILFAPLGNEWLDKAVAINRDVSALSAILGGLVLWLLVARYSRTNA